MLIYFLYIFWSQQCLWISHLQWIIFPNRQMALPSVWSWCTASSSLRGKNIKIPLIPPRSHFSPHFCHLPPSPASPPPLHHFFNSSSFSKSFSPSSSSFSRPVVQTALFPSAEWWLLSKHWREKRQNCTKPPSISFLWILFGLLYIEPFIIIIIQKALFSSAEWLLS